MIGRRNRKGTLVTRRAELLKLEIFAQGQERNQEQGRRADSLSICPSTWEVCDVLPRKSKRVKRIVVVVVTVVQSAESWEPKDGREYFGLIECENEETRSRRDGQSNRGRAGETEQCSAGQGRAGLDRAKIVRPNSDNVQILGNYDVLPTRQEDGCSFSNCVRNLLFDPNNSRTKCCLSRSQVRKNKIIENNAARSKGEPRTREKADKGKTQACTCRRACVLAI